jgi:hypothetical protein
VRTELQPIETDAGDPLAYRPRILSRRHTLTAATPCEKGSPADDGRHFGLVVDDKEAARAVLKAAGIAPLEGPFLDFRDPWGNRIEIVGYDNIQFTKAPNVLRGMGLTHLTKNENAQRELAKKGMAIGQG